MGGGHHAWRPYPSHRTNSSGQRCAYDLLKVDEHGGVITTRPARSGSSSAAAPRSGTCAEQQATRPPVEIVRSVVGIVGPQLDPSGAEDGAGAVECAYLQASRLLLIFGNHVIVRSGDVFAGSPTWRPDRSRSPRVKLWR